MQPTSDLSRRGIGSHHLGKAFSPHGLAGGRNQGQFTGGLSSAWSPRVAQLIQAEAPEV